MKLLHSALRITLIFQLVFACCLFDLANSQVTTQGLPNTDPETSSTTALDTTESITTAPGIVTTTAPAAINVGLVGTMCSDNTTTEGGCVENASCNNLVCGCNGGYFAKANGRCGITTNNSNADCNQRNENCVDHAICEYPLTTPAGSSARGHCECDDYHYQDGGTCKPRRTAGSNCNYNATNKQGVCTHNADCRNNSICECTDNSYKNASYYCLERIKPGKPCGHTADGDSNCIKGADCAPNNTCQCLDPHFKLTEGKCLEVIQVGGTCDNTKTCTENAHCSGTLKCDCNADFFFNHNEMYCQLRKSLDAVCNEDGECILHATCNESVCQCDGKYYNQNHRCNLRLQLNHQCDSSVPNQCLDHGECVNGICQCDRNSFKSGPKCETTLRFGTKCDLEVSDPRQCESNTTCGFHPNQDSPQCGCDVNHFFNGEYCVKRAAAGDSCPYASNSSLGLRIPDAEFQRQCVENAHCNTLYEICECSPGFYDRSGRCPKQIQSNGPCDPWTNYPHQCGNDNQCLYGRCVPQH